VEKLLYYFLERLKVPHTPKWSYDHSKKFSENMVIRDEWKKKKLFDSSVPNPLVKLLTF
jgi:hypothetical protein